MDDQDDGVKETVILGGESGNLLYMVAPFHWHRSKTWPGLAWTCHNDDFRMAWVGDMLIGPLTMIGSPQLSGISALWQFWHTDPEALEILADLTAKATNPVDIGDRILRVNERLNQNVKESSEAMPAFTYDGHLMPTWKETMDMARQTTIGPEIGKLVLSTSAVEQAFGTNRFVYGRIWPHGGILRVVHDETVAIGITSIIETTKRVLGAAAAYKNALGNSGDQFFLKVFESTNPILIHHWMVWLGTHWDRIRAAALKGGREFRLALLEWPYVEAVQGYMVPEYSSDSIEDLESALADVGQVWGQEADFQALSVLMDRDVAQQEDNAL